MHESIELITSPVGVELELESRTIKLFLTPAMVKNLDSILRAISDGGRLYMVRFSLWEVFLGDCVQSTTKASQAEQGKSSQVWIAERQARKDEIGEDLWWD